MRLRFVSYRDDLQPIVVHQSPFSLRRQGAFRDRAIAANPLYIVGHDIEFTANLLQPRKGLVVSLSRADWRYTFPNDTCSSIVIRQLLSETLEFSAEMFVSAAAGI